MILPFRCDAPDRRRYLELTLTPLEDEQIEFASTIIREEPRASVKVLESDMPRSDVLLKMCCMCKKVDILEDVWLEIEDAILALGLFEEEILPQITHGFCPACYEIALAEIRKFTNDSDALKLKDS